MKLGVRDRVVAAVLAALLAISVVPASPVLAATPTTASLVVAPPAATYGDEITFTATVTDSSEPGSPVNVGIITFADGSVTFGTANVLDGTATLVSGAVPAGTYTNVVASYADSGGTYDPSNSSGSPQSLTIDKAGQTISFSEQPDRTFDESPIAVAATADSGLTVTFSSLTTGVCTVAGTTVTFVATGDCTIRAAQGGNTNYEAASNVDRTFAVGEGSSSTVLSSNHNPSVFGQPVTFSATVSGGGATPTGTVTFRDGAATLGTDTLDGSGVATYTTAALPVTTHSITATYGGNADYSASTSAGLSQVVGTAGTTLGLATSDASSVYGQNVTFTATVSATPPGAGTASGTVQFRVDGLDFGAPVALAGGQATLATPALGAGSHEITAAYAGDGSFNGSFATLAGDQTVAKKTLTVTADDASREYGQANPPYTATITGFVNGETLATSGVTGSPACTSTATETSPVSGSPYPITCAAGNLAAANYTFAFAAGDLTVAAATSTVALVSSINPAVPSQPVTLTATVTGPVTGLPAPGGSIAFQARSGATWTTFASQALTAAFSASTAVTVSSTEGTYDYRAVFTSPDGNYANGTGELVQSVGKSPVTVTITSSRPAWETNVPLAFAATISPEATGATVPVTGTVDFTVDGGATQAVAVANGVASLPAGALALGDHTITAAYSGDASFLGGTATPLTGTVVPNVVDATGVGVSGSSIYPVKDTWRDTVAIRGTRNEPLGVTIRIYSPTGRLILTKTITTGTGAYSYSWNGRYSSGTIRPAGKYKVVQTHTDRSSAPALAKTWTSYVTLSTRRMYWTTVSLYKNANAPSMWSGSPSLLTSSRYANGARMITPSSVSGWAAFGYQFTLPSATTITKVAFYVQGGPWSGANAPKVGLNDWRASAAYGTCSSTSWCQAYSPTRVRRAVGTSTTSWYGISGDPAAVVRTVSGKRYVRGFVDTGGWFAGFRYEFARVRLVVTYGVLR